MMRTKGISELGNAGVRYDGFGREHIVLYGEKARHCRGVYLLKRNSIFSANNTL
jgi:hypothetical protein